MDNKIKTLISVFVVAAIVLTTIGVSYSYLTDNLSGGEGYIDVVNSNNGKLEFAYSSGTSIDFSNVTAGNDAIYAKTFTVMGTSINTNNLDYKVYLVIDENTFNDNDLTFSLIGYNPINNGSISANIDKKSILKSDKKIELSNGYFNNADGVVHTFDIKFYLNSNNKNGSFKAHIEGIEG